MANGETVTITVVVINNGETSGSYEVPLFIDNRFVESKIVTLPGKATGKVFFTSIKENPGSHKVEINGKEGEFIVEPSQKSSTTSGPEDGFVRVWVLAGIVGGLFFIITFVITFLRGRHE